MSVNKTAIARGIINLIAGAGVSKITNDVITNNTEVETTMDQILVGVGSIVFGMITADAGSRAVTAKFDAISNAWRKSPTDEEATTE